MLLSFPGLACLPLADPGGGLVLPSVPLLLFAGVGAVWGGLNGTWAIITGLNKAYGIEEGRPWWGVLSVTIGLSVLLSIVGLIALLAKGGRLDT